MAKPPLSGIFMQATRDAEDSKRLLQDLRDRYERGDETFSRSDMAFVLFSTMADLSDEQEALLGALLDLTTHCCCGEYCDGHEEQVAEFRRWRNRLGRNDDPRWWDTHCAWAMQSGREVRDVTGKTVKTIRVCGDCGQELEKPPNLTRCPKPRNDYVR